MDDLVKVVIVDDHEIFRNGLKMVLNKLKYTEVVAEASNGHEVLDIIRMHKVDLILMDVEMPVMNGIDATSLVKKEQPDIKIIALTMFNDDEYVQSMIDAGVSGFLIKNISKDTLDKAIQTVIKGGNYYSEELFKFFTRQFKKDNRQLDEVVKFTNREREILQLLSEGLSNKEIADILFVSERTIVGHKSNLLAKTGCKSTISLLSYALKHKLVIIADSK